MKNNIDDIVSRYISLWLEIPVNSNLSIVNQIRNWTRADVTIHKTHPVSSDIQKQI